MIRLAVGAGDPVIYAMALSACNTYTDAAPNGACQQITLNTWARLDSDNAMPWLFLAGQAHAKNDAAAEAAAFGQAARAHKADDYSYFLQAYSQSELPTDVTPLQRWYLAMELIGIESASGWPFGNALKHCSAEAMDDGEVRRQCGALAELLVSKGATMIDFGIGAGIGARVGWAKTRVAELKEEREALMQAMRQANPTSDKDLWTCEGVSRGNAWIGEWARLGEMGAARELLDRSGETLSELAQKHRDFMDQIGRDFRQRQESSPSEPPP